MKKYNKPAEWLAKRIYKLFSKKFNFEEAWGALGCFDCKLKKVPEEIIKVKVIGSKILESSVLEEKKKIYVVSDNLFKRDSNRLLKKRLKQCGYLE